MAVKKSSKASPRTALVVLGMHRSGTSALAGVLGQMGCDLPGSLMPPTEMNERGYFESTAVMQLNDAMLASAGQEWDSFPPVPADWFASPKAEEFVERAVEVLEQEFGRSYLFVLKDPRQCRLVPVWERAFEAFGCSAAYVMTHRAPQEVSASMERWYGYDADYGTLLWLRHVLEAEAATRGARRIFVSYDQLLTDWAATMRRIGSGLDLRWPRGIEATAPAVLDFLSRDLRHFSKAAQEGRASGPLPEWVRDTQSILDRWSETGEKAGDLGPLDAIRESFNAASRSFATIVGRAQALKVANDQQREEAQGLRDQYTALSGQYDVVVAERDAAAHNHATEQKNRAAAEQRAAESARTLEQLQAELAAVRAQSDSHQHNHAAEQRLRGEAQAAAVQADEATRALQQEFAETKADLLGQLRDEQQRARDATAAFSRLEQEAARLEAALEDERGARQQAESALRQRQQEAEDHSRQAQEFAARCQEAEAALSELEAEYQALKKQAGRDAKHLAVLTRQASARMRNELDARLAERRVATLAMDRALSDSQREIEEQAAKARSLQDSLSAAHATLDRERRARAEAQERIEALEASLNHQQNAGNASVQEHQRALEQTRAELLAAQARLAAQEAEHAAASLEREQARQRLDDAEAALRAAQEAGLARQAELDRRLAESEAHRQALMQSTSWRLTAPLRRLVRTIRRDKD